MKKAFFLLSALLLCSVMVFAVSAAVIEVPYTLDTDTGYTGIYIDESGKHQFVSNQIDLSTALSENSFVLDSSSFMETVSTYGMYPYVGSINFRVSTDSSVYDSLDLSQYRCTLEWRTAPLYDGASVSISSAEAERVGNHVNALSELAIAGGIQVLDVVDLAQYSNFSGSYMIGDTYLYGSYTFPETMTEDVLTGIRSNLPYVLNMEVETYMRIYLTPINEETTAPDDDTTDTPEIYEPTGEGTLTDPLIYPYDLYFNIDDTKSVVLSDELTVTDVYNDGTGYKFRDYENYYTVGVQSLMTHEYDTLISMVRNSDSSDAFVDSVCEIFSATFPCSLSVVDGVLDTSRYGFRMEWYFSSPNDWVFENFKDNIGKINSSFYNLEPFSVTVDNVTIPYDYFIFTYLPSSDTFKVTLELDGKDATDRMFMNAFLNHGGEITITYTLDWDIADGVLFGITQSGFYVKYSDDGEQIVPDSATPSTGGFTQEDLDKARNEGYWEGVSSKVDKNYIFGFVNGIFSSLYNGWNTLGNGISIGGTTLAETVYSCLIMIALIAFAKWVI